MLARFALLAPWVAVMVFAAGCGAGSAIDTDGGGAVGGAGTSPHGTTSGSTTTSTSTLTATLLDPGLRLGQGVKPSCLKHADGTVVCVEPSAQGYPEIVPLPGITDAVAVVRSFAFGCVLRAGGAVSCWGSSGAGELGLAVPVDGVSEVPVTLPGVALTKIAAGTHSVCGIEPSGQAVCWGGSSFGPLGDPSVYQSQTPVKVIGVPDAIDIAQGLDRACAVRANGEVRCWVAGVEPHPVSGVVGASQISLDADHACAVVGGGEVACWHQATDIVSLLPGIHDAVQVSVQDRACVRRASGDVTCVAIWSGAGVEAKLVDAPIHDAVHLGAADQGGQIKADFCAVQSTGDVSCWPINAALQAWPYPGW